MLRFQGHEFENEDDYNNAVKDQEIIDEISNKYNLYLLKDIDKAYIEIQNVRFKSSLGREFEDKLYDLRHMSQDEISRLEKLSGKAANKRGKSEKGKSHARTESGASKKADKKADKRPVGDSQASAKVDKRTVGDSQASAKVDKPATKRSGGTSQELSSVDRKAIDSIRKHNRIRSFIVVMLMVVSLVSIGFFIKYFADANAAQKEAKKWAELKGSEKVSFISVTAAPKKTYSEEVKVPEILDEYKILYNKNKSLIGWIKIADTNIDYPVMQTVNNEYYLKHNFDQEEDKNGCIFMDAGCDVITGCDNYIVYGHHMQSGKMFANLEKFGSEEFYEKHKTFEFDTIYEKGKYEIMFVFRSRVYDSDEIVFKYYQFINAVSEKDFYSAMDEMAALSLYETGVTAQYGDQLLTLSTCDYQETNGRFVVVAKRIE